LKTFALIVTFNPIISGFLKNFSEISKQVDHVIIVDNSNDELTQRNLKENFDSISDATLMQPGDNLGIAYAQNLGFLQAIKLGAEFIITFDQDSSVKNNLIKKLHEEYEIAKGLGYKIACVGPSVINERNNKLYEKYFKNSSKLNGSMYSVKSIISSGTLYNVDVFAAIGFNKAEWFIDSIDIEWCYRARYLGYHVVMTTAIAMMHNLGSSDKKLPLGKSINVGSPFRLYYVYRNWILSLREPQFELSYKLKLLFMMPVKFFIFANIDPRKERISYILRGIKDGIMKRHSFKNKKP